MHKQQCLSLIHTHTRTHAYPRTHLYTPAYIQAHPHIYAHVLTVTAVNHVNLNRLEIQMDSNGQLVNAFVTKSNQGIML